MGIFLIDSWNQKKRKSNQNFLDQLSLYQENLFHLKNFSRQTNALSVEFVSLDWFSQTRCLVLLFTFLNTLQSFLEMKESNWPLVVWLVDFSFMTGSFVDVLFLWCFNITYTLMSNPCCIVISLSLLQCCSYVATIFYVYFRLLWKWKFTQMLSPQVQRES